METDVEPRTTGGAVPEDQFRYRLLLARLHAGNLTTRQAAERCDLSYVSWSNWERGMLPRDKADVASKVSEGLGVSREWLLWGGPLAPETRRRRDRHGRRTPAGRINERYAANTPRTAPSRPPSRPDTTRSAPPDRSAPIKNPPPRTARTRPHWTGDGATT